MCVLETMSLVGYKIVYIVNFVPNPDWHLDSKCRSRNRDGGRVLKKASSMVIELVATTKSKLLSVAEVWGE